MVQQVALIAAVQDVPSAIGVVTVMVSTALDTRTPSAAEHLALPISAILRKDTAISDTSSSVRWTGLT